MQDELDYILSGLNSKQGMIVKRGSAYNLVKLCKGKALKLGTTLRSQGLMDRVINTLAQNLPDEVLGFCTAAYLHFFVQEPLNAEYVTPDFLQVSTNEYGDVAFTKLVVISPDYGSGTNTRIV